MIILYFKTPSDSFLKGILLQCILFRYFTEKHEWVDVQGTVGLLEFQSE